MSDIIRAQSLQKTFKIKGNKKFINSIFKPQWQYKHAVDSVSFCVSTGEAVAFLGPNGAGKTTTTKMLTGLVYPTAGELSVLGFRPFDRKYEFLKKIGLVMGNKAGLNWDLSARQSFELLRKIYNIKVSVYEERVKKLTKLLHVEHVLEAQVRRLSLGERMKLELIGALLHDPDILFLDEPTIGLDIASKHNVRKFLREIHEEGKTLLLTSHDMDDISEVCQRVIVINHGVLMYDDSMRALNNQYTNKRFVRLEFGGETPSRQKLEVFGDLVSSKDGVVVLGLKKDRVVPAITKLTDIFNVQDITIEQVPLEVVMSGLYQRVP